MDQLQRDDDLAEEKCRTEILLIVLLHTEMHEFGVEGEFIRKIDTTKKLQVVNDNFLYSEYMFFICRLCRGSSINRPVSKQTGTSYNFLHTSTR
jgi:hypothetical protein